LSKPRIAKAVAIVIGVVWLLSGSGCSEKKKSLPEASPFTVDEVQDAFKRETGDELFVEDVARGVPIIGDATLLGVRPEVDEKYGDFGITVYMQLDRRKRDLFIDGRSPDDDGIYWRNTPVNEESETPYWSAQKYYGNVGLIWFHRSRRTNQQWKLLDQTLSRLVSG